MERETLEIRIVGTLEDLDNFVELLRGIEDLYAHGDMTWTEDFKVARVLSVSKRDYPWRSSHGRMFARYLQFKLQPVE